MVPLPAFLRGATLRASDARYDSLPQRGHGEDDSTGSSVHSMVRDCSGSTTDARVCGYVPGMSTRGDATVRHRQRISRTMVNVTYPVDIPCESEWGLRSLVELVAHLTQWYRQPMHRRIEAIASALLRIRPSIPQRDEAYHRVAALFTSLRKAIDDHCWLEDQILCPAIIAVEQSRSAQGRRSHDLESTEPSDREALCHLILSVADEHNCLRRGSVALGEAVPDMTGPCVSVDEALLATDVAMLALLLHEQLDLEDRCLWPRALTVLQRET